MYTYVMNFKNNPLLHYAGLSLIFLLFILVIPASQKVIIDYNLSASQYKTLLLIYVLPLFGIWFAAFFAYDRLRQYAKSIATSPEGKGFKALSLSCGWMAYSLPIGSIIGVALFGAANSSPSFRPESLIITNYVVLVLALVGFILFSRSARLLNLQTNTQLSKASYRNLLYAFIAFGLVYCYVSLRSFEMTSILSSRNVYFLPVWVVVITLTIPYLYSWFVGMLAAYEISLHARQSKGLLYRRALLHVGYGIAVVIISSIALQCLTSLSPRTGQMSVTATLVSGYIINLTAVAGYALIAYGAIKLKRIEEV